MRRIHRSVPYGVFDFAVGVEPPPRIVRAPRPFGRDGVHLGPAARRRFVAARERDELREVQRNAVHQACSKWRPVDKGRLNGPVQQLIPVGHRGHFRQRVVRGRVDRVHRFPTVPKIRGDHRLRRGDEDEGGAEHAHQQHHHQRGEQCHPGLAVRRAWAHCRCWVPFSMLRARREVLDAADMPPPTYLRPIGGIEISGRDVEPKFPVEPSDPRPDVPPREEDPGRAWRPSADSTRKRHGDFPDPQRSASWRCEVLSSGHQGPSVSCDAASRTSVVDPPPSTISLGTCRVRVGSS